MSTITVGATATLTWQPPSSETVTLTVTLPDGTTTSPSVSGSQPATASVVTSQAGRHLLSWAQTGVGRQFSDVLDVWPADPHYMISLDDGLEAIKANGRTPDSTTRNDLALYVAAASYVIEDMVGPAVTRETTYTTTGGRESVVLPAVNVSVVSVVVDGSTWDASTYTVDTTTGIVYAKSGYFPATSRGNVVVTYRTGSGALAANLRLACMEQVRFLWQVAKVGRATAAQDLGYTPSGFAVPYMVQGLCKAAPDQAPGFA